MPRLTALSGAKLSAQTFLPAPSQPCVMLSPMKITSASPLATMVRNCLWRGMSRLSGLTAGLSCANAGETKAIAAIAPIKRPRCLMLFSPMDVVERVGESKSLYGRSRRPHDLKDCPSEQENCRMRLRDQRTANGMRYRVWKPLDHVRREQNAVDGVDPCPLPH